MGDTLNNSLKLRDIHLPGDPSFWPLAPGWWLLLILVLLIGAWLVLKLLRRMRQKKHQQQILNEYTVLETKLLNNPNNEAIANINIFLRRLAISKYPRTDIASLTGANWLRFLDESGNTQAFSKGIGRILVDAPYQSGELKNFNSKEFTSSFTSLIRAWIKDQNKKSLTQTMQTMQTMQTTQIRDRIILKEQNEKSLKKGGMGI